MMQFGFLLEPFGDQTLIELQACCYATQLGSLLDYHHGSTYHNERVSNLNYIQIMFMKIRFVKIHAPM